MLIWILVFALLVATIMVMFIVLLIDYVVQNRKSK